MSHLLYIMYTFQNNKKFLCLFDKVFQQNTKKTILKIYIIYCFIKILSIYSKNMNKYFKQKHNYKFLNQKKIYKLFNKIALGQLNESQLSFILTNIDLHQENFSELIIGATKSFFNYSKPFSSPKYLFSDVVGTGGDNSNTINISTTSAFVASFCGFKIAKHCNTGVTSITGSSNLLNSFNIDLHLSPEKSLKLLNELNICFLYSPFYHPGFKHVAKIRKKLNIKTIFNIIGPLLNPAKPPLIVVGVYKKNIMLPMIYAIKHFQYKHALVIHSSGTDEVTLYDKTHVAELKNNQIFCYELNPIDFGIKKHSDNFSIGGNTQDNNNIIKKILKGKSNIFLEQIIAANVAMILKVFGHSNLKKNTSIALNAIRSGKVYNHVLSVSKNNK